MARLLAACAEADPTIPAVSAAEWKAFAARGFNRGARDFALATEAGAVTGLLTSTLLDTRDPPLRHFRVLVRPDRRRRGVGDALFHVVEGQDEPGSATLQSNVPERWGDGRRFLERRGFRAAREHLEMERAGPAPDRVPFPEGTTPKPYAGGEADVIAWRTLNDVGYADDPDRQDLTGEDVALLSGAEGFGLWFAESGGREVALCHVVGAGAGEARVESLVVAPGVRGRGTGRALLARVLELLEARGVERVELGVAAANVPAVELYRSLGFETVERTTTYRRS